MDTLGRWWQRSCLDNKDPCHHSLCLHRRCLHLLHRRCLELLLDGDLKVLVLLLLLLLWLLFLVICFSCR